jgi:cystathionine beta-lyase/cystathionine gamma-synthase
MSSLPSRSGVVGSSNNGDLWRNAGSHTRALHAGAVHGLGPALVTPLVQSTTFVQDGVGEPCPHAYSRVSNPTVDALELALGELENALPAVSFSTGLAAETALFLSLLKAGDHCVVAQAVYGGTVRLFRQLLSDLGITFDFLDATRVENVSRAIRPETKLVFVETPANPTLVLTDIAAIARVTRIAGIPLAVDNTFLTSVLQQPLELGADISLYSTTKHIEGHSTSLGGAIVTRDQSLVDRLKFVRKSTGSIQTPFNAWLTLRGISTLPLRIRRHSTNALTVARWLAKHPAISNVYYPGLSDYPQRELAAAQHIASLEDGSDAHGGVVAFELVGGTEAAVKVMNSVQLCSLVEHIGSVETLITHPATMTHADVPKSQRLEVGITDGLIRLSVGLEDTKDIIADLERAIAISQASENDERGAASREEASCAAIP